MRRGLTLSLCLLCSTPAARSANPVEVSPDAKLEAPLADEAAVIFGLRIGAPLTLPACAPGDLTFAAPRDGGCFAWSESKRVGNSGPATAVFFVGVLPWYVRSGRLTLELIDGKLEYVAFSTDGLKVQAMVNEQLRAKFGPPSITLPQTMRTVGGAVLETGSWLWKVGDVSVIHIGAVGRVDYGQVSIGTKAGDDASRAHVWVPQPKRPL